MRSLVQVILIIWGCGNYHARQRRHATLKVRSYAAIVSALNLFLRRFETLVWQVVLAVFINADVVQDATLDVETLFLYPLRLCDTRWWSFIWSAVASSFEAEMRWRDSNLRSAKHFLHRANLVTVGCVVWAVVRVWRLCAAHRSYFLVLCASSFATNTYLTLGDVPKLFISSHKAT